MNNSNVAPQEQQTTDRKAAEDALTIQVSGFTLPPSILCSDKTLSRLLSAKKEMQALAEQIPPDAPNVLTAALEQIPDIQRREAELTYTTAKYQYMAKHYPVTLETQTIAGVEVEIFTPKAGVSKANKNRVLINLHGGAFVGGSRSVSHLESMPVAAEGQIKVISIDYRMAPEHIFPAATDDIVAVYRALLQQYAPENIGIYGCSAGAVLSAQSMARFQQEGLPQPAAIAMSCASGHGWHDGDSGYFAAGMQEGYPEEGICINNLYFKSTDPDDPLVFPGKHPAVLEKFPPSLLMVGTRDFALSSVVKSHSELVRLGVLADLHVWEGLEHAFLYDAALEESQQAFQVLVKFFDRFLGGGLSLNKLID